METKSTDRKHTLLHYIANVVKEKYPVVCVFYNELHYIEKAAAGKSPSTLKNILIRNGNYISKLVPNHFLVEAKI